MYWSSISQPSFKSYMQLLPPYFDASNPELLRPCHASARASWSSLSHSASCMGPVVSQKGRMLAAMNRADTAYLDGWRKCMVLPCRIRALAAEDLEYLDDLGCTDRTDSQDSWHESMGALWNIASADLGCPVYPWLMICMYIHLGKMS